MQHRSYVISMRKLPTFYGKVTEFLKPYILEGVVACGIRGRRILKSVEFFSHYFIFLVVVNNILNTVCFHLWHTDNYFILTRIDTDGHGFLPCGCYFWTRIARISRIFLAHGWTRIYRAVRMLFLNTNFTNIFGTWMDSGFTVRMVIDEHEYLEYRIFLGTRILTLSLQKIFV